MGSLAVKMLVLGGDRKAGAAPVCASPMPLTEGAEEVERSRIGDIPGLDGRTTDATALEESVMSKITKI